MFFDLRPRLHPAVSLPGPQDSSKQGPISQPVTVSRASGPSNATASARSGSSLLKPSPAPPKQAAVSPSLKESAVVPTRPAPTPAPVSPLEKESAPTHPPKHAASLERKVYPGSWADASDSSDDELQQDPRRQALPPSPEQSDDELDEDGNKQMKYFMDSQQLEDINQEEMQPDVQGVTEALTQASCEDNSTLPADTTTLPAVSTATVGVEHASLSQASGSNVVDQDIVDAMLEAISSVTHGSVAEEAGIVFTEIIQNGTPDFRRMSRSFEQLRLLTSYVSSISRPVEGSDALQLLSPADRNVIFCYCASPAQKRLMNAYMDAFPLQFAQAIRVATKLQAICAGDSPMGLPKSDTTRHSDE